MVETKIRLSMVIPGATMISSQDCEKMSKEDAFEPSTLNISYKVKKGKKEVIKRETLYINTRKSIPARQSISISKEAYSYMIDPKEIPTASMRKTWPKLSLTKRLEYHLAIIAEHFNAISYSYEIFND